ncbi:GNAT family N-acetyltransferase [Actinomadura violacea]|uniref:N-acetyltransferase n=1 Tax=Actinomadura violacea TaxID=2819934 RepID=A0ABS3RJW7_9ACTN|nr:N-acetyltransferase [Actinomadura violacea]MBO2457036.1 N-acetyltransferase [Actinomadura violacea]
MSGTWATRPETAADGPAVRRVVEAAFPTAEEADLVDALRGDAAWLPGLSFVAEDPAGRVAGYALLTRCRVGGADALALAPVAVLPEYQRRGAGGAAVRAALAAAAGRGERLVVVLGHPAYYPRFGFVRASSLGISAAFEVPDEALMALVLDGPSGAGASGAVPSGAVPSGVIEYATPFGV